MTTEQRKFYHSTLWPAAKAGLGLRPRDRKHDQELRRKYTSWVCEQISVGRRDSASLLGPAEITALFTFLRSAAEPDNLTLARHWEHCRANHQAFHSARHADWHEEEAFGRGGSGKLQRNRFGGRRRAVGDAFDPLSEKETRQRLLTMRKHHEQAVEAGDLAETPF